MSNMLELPADLGLGHSRILVIGDLILDRYTIGEAERISPEAPVLVLRESEDEVRLGGAANVAAFLRGLEAEVILCGIIGDDSAGRTLLKLGEEQAVDLSGIVTVADRPTTVKHRFAGRSGSSTPHQLLRVDREVRDPIDPPTEEALVARLRDAIPTCSAVLISDYAKGVGTPTLLQAVIALARQHGKAVLIDPSRGGDPQRYAGATMITPNRIAAELWVGHPVRSDDEVRQTAETLRQQLQLEAAILTLDRDGLAFADETAWERIPCRPREVCDVTGAGDMVLAMLGLCTAEHMPLRDSLRIANIAAGLEVERFGVTPISRAEIAAELHIHDFNNKETTVEALRPLLARARDRGERIVFTNGCFDLLHAGHIQLLQQAAELGDHLVVAINSDASVRRLKGSTRPIIGEQDRALQLAALACVDHVVIFDDDTPHSLLLTLRPDLLVKGGTTEHIVGRDIVEAYGGLAVQLQTMGTLSTTRLVHRISERRLGEQP